MDLMAPVFKIVKDTLNDFKGLRDIYIVKTDDITFSVAHDIIFLRVDPDTVGGIGASGAVQDYRSVFPDIQFNIQ